MRILTYFLCLLALLATGLPLINSAEWWIRIFDFPRVQILVICTVALILSFFYVKKRWIFKGPLMLLLGVALIYQVQFVLVYTPLSSTEAKSSINSTDENSFSLLVSNVRMDNEDKDSFYKMVQHYKPDVLLINEPDEKWAKSIRKLDEDFPFSIYYPLSNTYGMILLSKLPLSKSSVNFLVEEDIPSIYTQITLPSGDSFDFYGVHPEPPKPGTDTYERDTELLIIGKKIKELTGAALVAGDLNDVGWSSTSKLFRKYSELVDPREGRGLYNTYSVSVPLLRYPLDHIFYSKEFGLISMTKLESIGSDHYPMFINLSFEPGKDNARDLKKMDGEEEEEVEEKIVEGKSEASSSEDNNAQ